MSGKRDSNWEDQEHGTIEGEDVTFRLGKNGSPVEGHTLLASGHQENDIASADHDHYGAGDGRNDNGTDNGAYNGPGSSSSTPLPSSDAAERRAAYGYKPGGRGGGGRRGGGNGGSFGRNR